MGISTMRLMWDLAVLAHHKGWIRKVGGGSDVNVVLYFIELANTLNCGGVVPVRG